MRHCRSAVAVCLAVVVVLVAGPLSALSADQAADEAAACCARAVGFLGERDYDRAVVECDKAIVLTRPVFEECMKAGISVVSANYRFSTDAPFPAQMHDGARAVQFVRSKAPPVRKPQRLESLNEG